MRMCLNRFFIIFCCLFLMVNISGCSFSDNGSEVRFSDNSTGYYFDVYSSESKDMIRNGELRLESVNDKLFFEIANSGQERQFSVQVFLDYQQVPFTVDNKEYNTFFTDFGSEQTEIYEFSIAKDIDINYQHSLLVILTAGSDIITKNIDFDMTDMYSIALNHALSYKENTLPMSRNKDYENTTISSQQSVGLLLNDDVEEHSRKMPEKELHVNANTPFELQYQVGGYSECDEVAIILTIGFNQAILNEKNYLLCRTDGNLVQGKLSIIAPREKGNYEIMAWAVKNPYNIEKNEYLPLDSSFRFTLVVE